MLTIKLKNIFSYAFVSILLLLSCNTGNRQNPLTLPTAMGRINQVVVIADKDVYQGSIGDTLEYYFESPYPVMPSYEPMFDLRYMEPSEVLGKPYQKEMRIFLLVADVSDTLSSTTKMLKQDLGPERWKRAQTEQNFNTSIGQDKWARGQIVIYLFGQGDQEVHKAIATHFEAIAQRIHKHDKNSLYATVYGIQKENIALNKHIKDSFGLTIKVPELYQQAIVDSNFLWIRMDNEKINQSLVFRKFKYVNQSQFSQEYIINMRNEYGKKFIQTHFEDAFMSTNIVDLPIFTYNYTFNNIYTMEVRGIWETVNDYMGGPYASYLLLNEAKGEVIFIDAFVYAPGEDKRDYMQQLDCIVKTCSF